MSDNEQDIQNQNTGRKYFAMIPRMANDDLTVYEYRLYGHYSQVCGQDGHACIESEKTTYTKCNMSRNTFIKARQGLIDKGFIQMIPAQPHEPGKVGHSARITVIDRWAENVNRYSKDTSNQNPSSDRHFKSEPLKGDEMKRPTDGDTSNQNPNKNNKKQLQQKAVVVSNTVLQVFGESEIYALIEKYGLERVEEVAAMAHGKNDPPAYAYDALRNGYKPSPKKHNGKKAGNIEDDGMRIAKSYEGFAYTGMDEHD